MVDIDGIEFVKILLVDDDTEYTKITKMYLESDGFNIDMCNNPVEALELLKNQKYDIILLDYFMPEMNGEEFLKELRKFNTKALVILQTGYSEQQPPINALTSLSIQGYFDKASGVQNLVLILISTIKTVNLLLYRANPDTNNIEYSFMSVGNSTSGVDKEVDLNFDDENIKGHELESDNNGNLENDRFYKISCTNVSDKEKYKNLKEEKQVK